MSRRKRETIEDYERLIRTGHGVGEGIDYKPWLGVRDVPSHGVSAKTRSMTVGRTHHTLSTIETNLLMLADFRDEVVDIREQFPLFPLDAVRQLACNVGISYPKVPKSTVPAILTTDFLLTRRIVDKLSYLAVAVKPSEELRKHRVLEKLEIERLWWESLGVEWKLATELNISSLVAGNLAWISKDMRGDHRLYADEELPCLEPLLETLETRIYTIESLFTSAAAELNCDSELAGYAISKAVWDKRLLIDMSVSIEDSGLINVVGWNQDLVIRMREAQSERSA